MGLWAKLFRRRSEPVPEGAPEETPSEPAADLGNAVELPLEPFVFECGSCGKVFEARRKRPACPECDSREVSLMSD